LFIEIEKVAAGLEEMIAGFKDFISGKMDEWVICPYEFEVNIAEVTSMYVRILSIESP
jgi:hypothetical protein